ncbi:MAG: hypothetical protein LAQ69_02195 [Acidobacteriia bacterium]|nr:hypothetical protein [Terriglobia bacterium]
MLTIRDQQMSAMAAATPGRKMIVPCEKTWIEVRLIDDKQKPVPGEEYHIVLPDSSIVEGSLDRDGRVRIEGILAGQCQITFPRLHRKEVKAV